MTQKILFIFTLVLLFASLSAKATPNNFHEKYQAIVLGKIIKEKVIKLDNYYITEYKLKIKKWFFAKQDIEKSKYITLKVLGADLPEKGIVIKASTTPDYMPIKKDAVFFLKKNKLNKSNVFTVSRDGIIYDKSFISNLKNTKEL